jgi:hypothetical protein
MASTWSDIAAFFGSFTKEGKKQIKCSIKNWNFRILMIVIRGLQLNWKNVMKSFFQPTVARFFSVQLTKTRKIYQMTNKHGNRMYQMAIKCINIFIARPFKIYPNVGFLVWKYTIWQLCFLPEKKEKSMSGNTKEFVLVVNENRAGSGLNTSGSCFDGPGYFGLGLFRPGWLCN